MKAEVTLPDGQVVKLDVEATLEDGGLVVGIEGAMALLETWQSDPGYARGFDVGERDGDPYFLAELAGSKIMIVQWEVAYEEGSTFDGTKNYWSLNDFPFARTVRVIKKVRRKKLPNRRETVLGGAAFSKIVHGPGKGDKWTRCGLLLRELQIGYADTKDPVNCPSCLDVTERKAVARRPRRGLQYEDTHDGMVD